METPNAIGFSLVLLAIVAVAGAELVRQFASRVFIPLCPRCGRRHSPECVTWGGLPAMTLRGEKKGK